MELSDGQKYAVIFLGSLAVAGIVLGTLVFPFWNFIREDVTEQVEIFSSADGNCYVAFFTSMAVTITFRGIRICFSVFDDVYFRQCSVRSVNDCRCLSKV